MVKKSPYPDLVIPEVSVHDFILDRIKDFGGTTAMVDNTRKKSITFHEIREQIIKCASALRKRGLKKGEVVAICSSNRLEYAMILLAVSACGGISTTCNPLYREREIIHQFKLSNPSFVFCEAEIYETIENISAELPTLREIFTFGEIVGKSVLPYNNLVLQDDGKDYPASVKIDPKDDLFILPYSSGTTGLPKGVMLTHRNLICQILSTSVVLFQGKSSNFYFSMPMFHAFGYLMTLYHLSVGALNVFDTRFEIKRLLRAVQDNKVKTVCAVPPIMIQLAQTKIRESYDVSSLQRIIIGGAPTPPTIVDDVEKLYRVDVVPSYGLTEVVPLSMSDPLAKKSMSVGIITPNTTVKVVNPENGYELGIGEDGEILAKGPQMTKGYLGNPEATARAIDSDGWFHTGDIGHYDDDGMLYVVDRLKELIKYKGFQVAPAELEALLMTHPDIIDAAVVGIPDPEAGELPKAFIVRKRPSLSESTVKRFIEGQVVSYKRLRGGVEFMTTIPKTPSGKILRRELRKRRSVSSRL